MRNLGRNPPKQQIAIAIVPAIAPQNFRSLKSIGGLGVEGVRSSRRCAANSACLTAPTLAIQRRHRHGMLESYSYSVQAMTIFCMHIPQTQVLG